MATIYTPTGAVEIDNGNPDPEKLEQVGMTRQQFEDRFNGERNWSNFRHALKGSSIFSEVVTAAIPAVMGAYLMDALRQNDHEDLVMACNMIDAVLSFSNEQKTEGNEIAADNWIGPIFEVVE